MIELSRQAVVEYRWIRRLARLFADYGGLSHSWEQSMLEKFITAFIVYFMVIDSIGNSPIFLAITAHLSKLQKIRAAIEGSIVVAAVA